MAYQVIARKYRPQNFEQLVGQNHISQTVSNALKSGRLPQALLFTGPRGTGKTSSARILAKSLRCLDPQDFKPCGKCAQCQEISTGSCVDVIEIDGASNNGVDAIRDEVTNFCETGGFGGLKVVIIDEADGLSVQAQDKLRGVINDYGDFVRFIFTANKIRSLSDALKSRARVFEIKALNEDLFVNRLVAILEAESVEIDVDILGQVIEETYPDLRKAIDLLQDCERDKKLVSPAASASGGPEWSQGVADIILNRGTAGIILELVTSIRRDEIVDVYRYLYEHSEIFEDKAIEMTAITVIAGYLKAHPTVAFPDINLAGCLIELVQLKAQE